MVHKSPHTKYITFIKKELQKINKGQKIKIVIYAVCFSPLDEYVIGSMHEDAEITFKIPSLRDTKPTRSTDTHPRHNFGRWPRIGLVWLGLKAWDATAPSLD